MTDEKIEPLKLTISILPQSKADADAIIVIFGEAIAKFLVIVERNNPGITKATLEKFEEQLADGSRDIIIEGKA